ncbi:hypothetical protein BDN70DRAFT_898895 [Pholiota conissans]|uniref:Secreted protein n=1 Tax=Pholiota conissans TaxID=109636 RepID=A0A9P5YRH9_9AGAR|nr:hypothetical protein BDN70DRAFT_898895 [Pholiota conissans]
MYVFFFLIYLVDRLVVTQVSAPCALHLLLYQYHSSGFGDGITSTVNDISNSGFKFDADARLKFGFRFDCRFTVTVNKKKCVCISGNMYAFKLLAETAANSVHVLLFPKKTWITPCSVFGMCALGLQKGRCTLSREVGNRDRQDRQTDNNPPHHPRSGRSVPAFHERGIDGGNSRVQPI